MENLKGVVFSEYQVNEISKKDRKRLLLCYPRRCKYLDKCLDKIKEIEDERKKGCKSII